MKNLSIVILLLCIGNCYCHAQDITVKEATDALGLLKVAKQDTNRVYLLQKAGRFYIEKPGEHKTDLDSALSLIQEAEQLSNKLSFQKGISYSYLLYSMAYREKRDNERGKVMIGKAIDMFARIKYTYGLGEAYMEQRNFYSAFASKEILFQRIDIAEKALLAFKQAGSKVQIAHCLKEIGDLYSIDGDYTRSIKKLKEALAVYQSINYSRLQSIYDILSAVYSISGEYKEAIRYGLLAMKTGERLHDETAQMSTIYNHLGITYYYLKDYEQAYLYFKKALTVAEKNKDLNTINSLAQNISHSLLKSHKYSEALVFLKDITKRYPPPDISSMIINKASFVTVYELLKQYTQGQTYCNELLELAEKPDLSPGDYSIIYTAVIPFTIATKQYKLAQKYLQLEKKLAEKSGSLADLSVNQLSWFEVDSAQGNYLSAIAHYQLHKRLNDSIFNEAKSQQIAQLQVQYETEKKDQDIKLKAQSINLLTKQTQVQQSEIQKSEIIRNTTLAGIVLLGIIMGLLYNQYRIKQKTNKQLQHLLTEKEWLLKEVHHRVKNNLQTVLSLLESQSHSLSNDALQAIQVSQNRVYAMSLIHKKLYQATNVASINMEEYLKELIQHLRESFSDGYPIHFHQNYESIQLDVSQAVPIGLIVNEAVTNAFKYAFPKQESNNSISVECKQTENNEILLTISDNGKGLPADFLTKRSNEGLGLKLIRGLTDDIDGKLTLTSDNGLSIFISFKATPTLNDAIDKTRFSLVNADAV
ncbi:tetratricopeptide repeat-containing sensor histidine kinase [Xanthocytophaga agilis]|uniref:histidine kinase n=1 Tax=Xanthocytophaga agilis TaxID=3048010 RepID=A0AAE3UJG0_9BACT|nr:histidine kinase dimerization/phosphoacceptor domain -containing protein [Xanthocytophaga agilis]MDJ1506776.1 histidine kinase dimerization/phosphoacceptor domain -containing protein [Xanthocytophaga agilis]